MNFLEVTIFLVQSLQQCVLRDSCPIFLVKAKVFQPLLFDSPNVLFALAIESVEPCQRLIKGSELSHFPSRHEYFFS